MSDGLLGKQQVDTDGNLNMLYMAMPYSKDGISGVKDA
jgi:hypothetical protein